MKDSKNQLIPFKLYENLNYNLPKFQNRIINYINLYDIYSEDSKSEKIDSKTSVLWSQHRDLQEEISSFIIHDKSNEINSKRFKECFRFN